jgi:hypothetical protein
MTGGKPAMGKKTYLINGKYFMVDEETGAINRIIIQDDSNIEAEDLKQLAIMLAEALAEKGSG